MQIDMSEMVKAMPFIIFFLILVLLVNMTAGDRFTKGLLALVLASMAVMNSDKLINLTKEVF